MDLEYEHSRVDFIFLAFLMETIGESTSFAPKPVLFETHFRAQGNVEALSVILEAVEAVAGDVGLTGSKGSQ